MIVVTLLLSIAMLGLLAVFDASARLNKNETDVADAQGSVRYGIYQMTRAIRMAGVGGLYVTQAVLNHADAGPARRRCRQGASYDNVSGVTVTDTFGTVVERPGRHGHDRGAGRPQLAAHRVRRVERLCPVRRFACRSSPSRSSAIPRSAST